MKQIQNMMREFLRGENIVYVATSDENGFPHIAAAEGMSVDEEERLCFNSWFCMKTMENLEFNPRVSVAVMNPANKLGYQLIGRVEKIEQNEVMDGYSPPSEERWAHYPQTRYRLVVDIEQVLEMSPGPHTDMPVE